MRIFCSSLSAMCALSTFACGYVREADGSTGRRCPIPSDHLARGTPSRTLLVRRVRRGFGRGVPGYDSVPSFDAQSDPTKHVLGSHAQGCACGRECTNLLRRPQTGGLRERSTSLEPVRLSHRSAGSGVTTRRSVDRSPQADERGRVIRLGALGREASVLTAVGRRSRADAPRATLSTCRDRRSPRLPRANAARRRARSTAARRSLQRPASTPGTAGFLGWFNRSWRDRWPAVHQPSSTSGPPSRLKRAYAAIRRV